LRALLYITVLMHIHSCTHLCKQPCMRVHIHSHTLAIANANSCKLTCSTRNSRCSCTFKEGSPVTEWPINEDSRLWMILPSFGLMYSTVQYSTIGGATAPVAKQRNCSSFWDCFVICHSPVGTDRVRNGAPNAPPNDFRMIGPLHQLHVTWFLPKS
jgi:hypothetical protein